jgi:HK97 family phage portal protein
MYARKSNGKDKVPGNPLYRLLHDSPNPEMTAMQFRETMMAHVLLWGNGYAEIERDGMDRIISLWPLPPNKVQVYRDDSAELYYEVTPDKPSEEKRVLRKRQVLHVPGLSFNGIIGYSPIAKLRESYGLAMAMEEFGARFFGSGTHPGLVVSHPGKLGKQAHENLDRSLAETYAGLGKSHRILLLEEAMKVEKIGIAPEEAQFLESRKFQIAEICRAFRVPLHMVNELDRATFSNIEHQSLEFVMHCIRPWLVRLEQAYNMQLLNTDLERRRYFWEHLIDGLLRGDIKSRYDAYAIGRQWGWLSADDIRELENMNPLPDGRGEVYLTPMNMSVIGSGGEIEQAEKPEEESQRVPENGVGAHWIEMKPKEGISQ